jgi:N-acyl-D-aspartate/D-glutamate deacylase
VRPDLVVRGGTVVDGSGRAPFEADVVMRGDRIAAVGRWDGSAGEVIDARGKLVTPGFVDVHTHLDAQLSWDPAATISTGLVVSALGQPQWLMEIDVIAVIPDNWQPTHAREAT